MQTNNIKKFSATTFRPDPKPPAKEKKKPQKIKNNSKKRAAEERLYDKLRPIFLEGKTCPITNEPATQVHHKKGRIGKLLCDMRFWLAVSAEGHDKIERNPAWAYEMGYSLLRNKTTN